MHTDAPFAIQVVLLDILVKTHHDLNHARHQPGDQSPSDRQRNTNMSFKKNYKAVRSMNWLWWCLVAFFAYNGAMALSSHVGHEPSPIAFVLWVAAATGVVIAIRRGNKARMQ